MVTNNVNSYTVGASNSQMPRTDIWTTAQQTQVIIQKSQSVRDTTFKSWKQWASDELDDIAKLGPNWDSYDGNPPSPLAITLAASLLDKVNNTLGRYEQSQPQIIAPRADGEIQIEWGTSPTRISVHTSPSGSLGYLYIGKRGDKSTYEEKTEASWDSIIQLIAKVVFTVPR